MDWGARAKRSLTAGGLAYERLLRVAERSLPGGGHDVAIFIAATAGHRPFDFWYLPRVDVETSDDMLACMDTIRWGTVHLPDLVVDGWARADVICERWGLLTPWREIDGHYHSDPAAPGEHCPLCARTPR